MKIRKGPYGSFAIELISDPEDIYEYAKEIIENPPFTNLLKAYDDDKKNGIELSFDFTGLMSLEEAVRAQTPRSKAAIGALFDMLLKAQDILLPLDNLVTDPEFVFLDPVTSEIKLIYLPLKTEASPELKSIGIQRLETLLGHDFFKDILTTDEITAIVYAFKNNDEETLKKLRFDNNEPVKKEKITSSGNLYAILTSAVSVISCILALLFLNRLFFYILSVVMIALLIKSLYDMRSSDIPKEKPAIERTKMLFGEEKKEENGSDELFSFASLESETNGSYGLYSSETGIGSDRFLADIFIDDSSLSPVQARIFRESDSYWLTDLSARNDTYIENRKLKPGERYEIKNGQRIKLADKEFVFKIGY